MAIGKKLSFHIFFPFSQYTPKWLRNISNVTQDEESEKLTVSNLKKFTKQFVNNKRVNHNKENEDFKNSKNVDSVMDGLKKAITARFNSVKRPAEDDLDGNPRKKLANNQETTTCTPVPNQLIDTIDFQSPLATSTPNTSVQEEETIILNHESETQRQNFNSSEKIVYLKQGQKLTFKLPAGTILTRVTEPKQINQPAQNFPTAGTSKMKVPNNQQKRTTVNFERTIQKGTPVFKKTTNYQRSSMPDNSRYNQKFKVRTAHSNGGAAQPTKPPNANLFKSKTAGCLLLNRESDQHVTDRNGGIEVIGRCNICTCLLIKQESIETICQHTFCRACFLKYVNNGGRNCKTCGSSLLQIVAYKY